MIFTVVEAGLWAFIILGYLYFINELLELRRIEKLKALVAQREKVKALVEHKE